MASLSRYEQETIIRFNEEEREAVIFTYNRALQRQLDKLAEDRPGEVSVIYAESEGSGAAAKEYRIHKQWVKVRPPRVLSVEERERLKEHGKTVAAKSLSEYRENMSKLGV